MSAIQFPARGGTGLFSVPSGVTSITAVTVAGSPATFTFNPGVGVTITPAPTADQVVFIDYVEPPPDSQMYATRTTIPAAEFTSLYARHQTLEGVANALLEGNFRGQVTMPNGTYILTSRPNLVGEDWSQIRFVGSSTTLTIITPPSGNIVRSRLWFGNCLWNGPLNLYQSEFSNMSNDGLGNSGMNIAQSIQALYGCQIFLNNTAVTGCLYAVYGCVIHADQTDFVVTDGVAPAACGVYIGEGSQLSLNSPASFITNPNAVPGATGVVVETNSYALISLARIGAVGQTIATGVSVAGNSCVIGPPVFVGTVTTQYSQAVNVRTNAGLIFG